MPVGMVAKGGLVCAQPIGDPDQHYCRRAVSHPWLPEASGLPQAPTHKRTWAPMGGGPGPQKGIRRDRGCQQCRIAIPPLAQWPECRSEVQVWPGNLVLLVMGLTAKLCSRPVVLTMLAPFAVDQEVVSRTWLQHGGKPFLKFSKFSAEVATQKSISREPNMEQKLLFLALYGCSPHAISRPLRVQSVGLQGV